MTAYYNEHDKHAAAWLRELIIAGLIAPGEVDERDIQQVTEADLAGFTQVHFFAGIGGWSYALRLAGWPDDRPVWTGSCPCQPFSLAGKQEGNKDARHLWPDFFRLIRQCRPVVVFGEQVESAVGKGWLDGISADLETEDYAIGSIVLGAHSVGAPHIRQRLWWVADAGSAASQRDARRFLEAETGECIAGELYGNMPIRFGDGGSVGGMADAQRGGLRSGGGSGTWPQATQRREAGNLVNPNGDDGGLGNTQCNGLRISGRTSSNIFDESGHWSLHDLIPCRDGKTRRVEPGTFPLAHGVSGRVGLLRGYGNAICPQVAAAFIAAYLASLPQPPSETK